MDWNARLAGFTRRVRWMRFYKFALIGASIGAFISVLLAVLDWAKVLYSEPLVLGIPLIGGALIGSIIGWVLKVDSKQLADSIDRRTGLGNRLATAVEGQDAEMSEAQSSDALAHLSNLQPKQAFPIRMTKWHAGPIVLSILAAAIFMLGNTPILLSNEAKAERKEVITRGTELIKVARPILEKPDGSIDAEAKKLANQLENLGRDMEKGRMTKDEALKKHSDLAKSARKLEQQRNEESKTALQSSKQSMKDIAMKQAAKEMGLSEKDAAALQNEQLDSLSSEELNEQTADLEQQLEELQEQIATGKTPDGKELSKEALAKMAKMQKELQDLLSQLKFSKKVRDFLKKMQSMPEFKKYMEAMRKLQETQDKSDQGKLDKPELTKAELEKLKEELKKAIEEMQKKLEEMADSMSDQDIKDMIEKMIEALEKGCGT